MKKKKVIQIKSELYKITGIQRVMMDIHHALQDNFDCRIMGKETFSEVNPNLGIRESDYSRFTNPLSLKDSVVIIHERRLLPLMWILTRMPGLNIHCIYIHHNELCGRKKLSLFPDNIVAISDRGIENLTGYFNYPASSITKIHNCVKETGPYSKRTKKFNPEEIQILYPARINDVKRQLAIVERLNGKLDPRVRILFAGIGPNYEALKKICDGNPQFVALGFRDDVPDLMKESDFTMLFSKHEGLPISLIETCQCGTPAICNDVGGNTEIVSDGENGFVCNDWDSLLRTLNRLPDLSQEEIDRMSARARESYEKNFKFDTFKQKYTELINSII